MDGRTAKLSHFIFTELFFDDVVLLVLSGTITLAFRFEMKLSQTKHFIDLTFSITA